MAEAEAGAAPTAAAGASAAVVAVGVALMAVAVLAVLLAAVAVLAAAWHVKAGPCVKAGSCVKLVARGASSQAWSLHDGPARHALPPHARTVLTCGMSPRPTTLTPGQERTLALALTRPLELAVRPVASAATRERADPS